MTFNIKFSHNWNKKLDNKVFTTIRSYSNDKFQYYFGLLGENCDILLKKPDGIHEYIGVAKLIDVQSMKFDDIPAGFLMIDTGISDKEKAIQVFRRFGFPVGTKDDPTWALILTFSRDIE